MKPLSKDVTIALKVIYKQIENYNFKTKYYLVLRHSDQFTKTKLTLKQ